MQYIIGTRGVSHKWFPTGKKSYVQICRNFLAPKDIWLSSPECTPSGVTAKTQRSGFNCVAPVGSQKRYIRLTMSMHVLLWRIAVHFQSEMDIAEQQCLRSIPDEVYHDNARILRLFSTDLWCLF